MSEGGNEMTRPHAPVFITASMSLLTALPKPNIFAFRPCLTNAVTAFISPSDAAGNPASSCCTPTSSSL